MGPDARALSIPSWFGCLNLLWKSHGHELKKKCVKRYIATVAARPKVITLKSHLGFDCEMHIVDLGTGSMHTECSINR